MNRHIDTAEVRSNHLKCTRSCLLYCGVKNIDMYSKVRATVLQFDSCMAAKVIRTQPSSTSVGNATLSSSFLHQPPLFKYNFVVTN